MSLGTLAINSTNDGFTLDGKPFFWLADTCWSAFTNITLEDWDYYLSRRAEQGFNVVQINTMPQWDRCLPDLGIYPYASDDGFTFDWESPNPAYWERVQTMCAMAVEHGIRPALVLVWSNYVPDTWAAPIARSLGVPVMPREEVANHVRRVHEYLGRFNPVYVITGDTDFPSPEATGYYVDALTTIRELEPDAICTAHINGGSSDIAPELVDGLDFYMFQSGHERSGQAGAWTLPQELAAKYPKKPMLNAEPCYEQMGAFGDNYWRFGAQGVRAAAWSSIFAGACAGVTYGALGIWNWRTSASTSPIMGYIFDEPFRWQEALQFPGAWDYGSIPAVLDALGSRSPRPAQEELDDSRTEIRLADLGDGGLPVYVAYMPYATKLKVKGELEGYEALALDLDAKRVAHLPVAVEEGATVAAQHPFASDALVVLRPAE